MNSVISKLLLAGDKFMRGMHLKQSGPTCSTCASFTKNQQRIQRDKRCMIYLPKRTR